MASLPQPMPYSYYPSSGSGSLSVRHAGRAAPDEGRGSYGPVLVVLSVITFLATAACIAGRLCGRRSSAASRGKSSSSADAEKGLGEKPPVVPMMRPLPSSRATVHDVLDDDVFEIKFAPVKPAGMGGPERDGGTGGGGIGSGGRVQALLPPPQLGLPRQYPAAGFRSAPATNGCGVARQAPHPQVRGAGGGASFAPPTKNQTHRYHLSVRNWILDWAGSKWPLKKEKRRLTTFFSLKQKIFSCPLPLLSDDASDEVRRRRPLLPHLHAPPPLLLLLLLLLRFLCYPPPRRRSPLFPILLALRSIHRPVAAPSSVRQRPEQGILGLVVGAGTGGTHRIAHRAVYGDQDQGAAGGQHRHRRRRLGGWPPCLHRRGFEGVRGEICCEQAENGLQSYMGGAPKHRPCCGPNDHKDTWRGSWQQVIGNIRMA